MHQTGGDHHVADLSHLDFLPVEARDLELARGEALQYRGLGIGHAVRVKVDQVVCKDPVQRSDVALHICGEAFLFELLDIAGGIGKRLPCAQQQ